ncbi:MAG: Methylenetetrahydrofolate dehydrogenase (NADP+) [Candidatus Ozemobacter sibiricus]|jgi:methylenetetrahydrofolate dehydrogenase (NADP+)/methenyltetrahydrofolate cyclohydrolase|uniref:Bifunctional protein FolD n=1 Tax=Candidatus Ozemobacter sibiricus TaxID=2268124 RepID=A0A367ZML4_9BACT|nr:MAG: Methylenetetrahydrofolate dehydrogenase (NADP+) [Candidatus Ozemobacter sibiricus]
MSATILDGAATARTIRDEVAAAVAALRQAGGPPPGLAVVLVGEDPASRVYVAQKHKACQEAGFHSEVITLPGTASEAHVLAEIARLNADPAIHGILVQVPLPSQIDQSRVMHAIDPRKDVDGFHPVNVGKLTMGDDTFFPCTPLGCLELLKRYRIPIQGKRALVIGRSNIVGKPVALLLLREHATVTIGHSRTVDLPGEVARADIVVAALGKPRFVQGAWIKEGAVVLDVGINQVPHPDQPGKTRLVGDVDFETARERAAFITPVPGGAGPMTIAMLLQNTLKARHLLVGAR